MPRAIKQHLVQRADGRYRCKYKGKEFYGSTEEEAFAAREAYLNNLNNSNNSNNLSITPTTVAEYAIPWLTRISVTASDSTYNSHAVMLQHLIDCIGYKKI